MAGELIANEVLGVVGTHEGDITNAELLGPANLLERATQLGRSALSYIGDRLPRPRRAGLAAGLAAVSLGGIGTAEAKSQPMQPGGFIHPIAEFRDNMFGGSTSEIFISSIVLSGHHLRITQDCSHRGADLAVLDDTLRGEYGQPCAWLGERATFIPRRQAGDTKIPTMDFRPVLYQLGNQAASSAGIDPAKHGLTDHLTVNFNPASRTSEADVYYKRGQAKPGTRRLKELQLLYNRGHETVRRTWY
jgi:hypothetical protein